ncbi:myosin heavy chain, embryonic smooth muscle isoform-like isoform X2 [Macrobrachium rosenbergii]|uniref:myosin heavy chain, embryonic smooth muscle isoform-like isoform X2 n=1 Tax=Macrobrachium rosenbergii TaxID=79674 RepID=UPI0034D5D220
MIRRGTGRTPPYILVGLVLVIVILGFNYWTLSSQNADLSQELEKLQSEIKISAMKQEQSEKKNSALQETVHEMDGLSNRLKKEIQDDKDALKASSIEVQKLKYEITTLKNKVAKMQEQISSLNQQAEDCEVDLSKAKETNTHLTQERDDAVEAIAEKDSMINSLKRQLEQVSVKRSQLTLSLATCNTELVQLKKECEEVQKASDDLANIIVQTKRDAQLESEKQLYAVKEQLVEEKNKSSMMQFSVDDLQKKLSQTFSDLAESQDKVSQLEATLHGLEIDKQKEKARSDTLDISVKDLTLKLSEANTELTKCQESLKTSALENAAELEKAQDEAAAARREKMAIAKPKIEPGMMNIPGIEHKEPYVGPGQLGYISRGAVHTRDLGIQGIEFHRELPILPRDPPNVPRKKPRFSVADIAREVAAPQNNIINGENVNGGVLAPPQSIGQVNPPLDNNNNNADQQLAAPGAPPVMERPAAPGEANNKPIQAPVHPGAVDGPGPQNDVLAPPPQHLQDENANEIKGNIDLDLQKRVIGVLGNDGEKDSENIAKAASNESLIKEERKERDVKNNEVNDVVQNKI